MNSVLKEKFITLINSPDDTVTQDVFLPISRGLMYFYAQRNDLQKFFPIDSKEGRTALIWWYLKHGLNEYPLLKLNTEQKKVLFSLDERIVQDQPAIFPKGLIEYYFHSPDLQNAFNLKTFEGRKELFNWWLTHWESRCTFLPPNQKNVDQLQTRQVAMQLETNGINIVGFARGELGIGEDVRMAAKSMESSQIPFLVYDAPLQLGSRIESKELESVIKADPIYHANLICLPGTVTFLLATNDEMDCLTNRYNIGAWQWELPNWPKQWELCLNLVDEIWAFSHYTEKMFRESTDKPVIYMPMCVEYPTVQCIPKAKFKLPENAFLFLCMFDSRSYISRKNPLAVVYSFLKAFPKNNQVSLVIKTMHGDEENSDWKKIIEIAANDKRIYIINETFSHAEVMGLIQICDAYVSLHRAEGFGRILAEALLLKKPVITTNFSGNTDFTNASTAFMVNGLMIPLIPGEYSVWEDQYWCDPDIDEAAKQMILCFENQSLREERALAGQKVILNTYSSKAVGERYRTRLMDLGLIAAEN